MRILLGGLLLILGIARQPECQTTPVPRSDSTAADTAYVEYHDSPLTLPLPFGFRTPAYDRVDGLTLPWGPRLELGDNKLTVDGVVAYRSHLGDFDPSLNIRINPSEARELTLFAGRGTFTNDDWIRGNLANTLASFGVGSDARNYFRGDRTEIKLTPSFRMGTFAVTPMLGGRFENDWSTGSNLPGCLPLVYCPYSLTRTSFPWSVVGRSDSLKMRRPNPSIASGHIGSALAGFGIAVDQAGLTAKLVATVEHAFRAPAPCCGSHNTDFTQATLSADATFPTFGEQRFTFRGHVLRSSGGLDLPQRYGYLGGAGTLGTVNLFAIGGSQLFFAQGDYYAPIRTIRLPYLGNPYVDLQYAAGTAGNGTWPPLIQNLGIGAGISYLRAGYTIDPARTRSPYSRKSDFSIGISLTK
jgi:hypothetical protein